MAQGRDHHPRSLLGSVGHREWDVCRDCLKPLAHELDGVKEEWFRPPAGVVDDEREDHFEVYEQHVQHCLSLSTVENAFLRFDIDRGILWMEANQREVLARKTRDEKADLLRQLREPIPNDVDGRNARAQILADFAWHLWRAAEAMDEDTTEKRGGKQSTESGKSATKGKRRGRKRPSKETIKDQAKLAADWVRARDSGVYKADFARQKEMTQKQLQALLDRVARRKARSNK